MPTDKVKPLATIALLFVFFLGSNVQLLSGSPTAEEILFRVNDLFEGIEDYAVEVKASVDMPGLRAPGMRATLYYKSPGKIKLESEGFAILPKEALAVDHEKFGDRYTPELQEEEDLEGRSVYRLKLIPKEESEAEFETVLLVDKEKFIVRKVQKLVGGEPILTVDFKYELIQDKFFLPSESRVELFLAQMRAVEKDRYFPGPGRKGVESLFQEEDEGPAKNGYATVKFEGYRINIGLPDSLFEDEKQKKSPGG